MRVGRGEAPDGGDLIRDWTVSTSLVGDLDACYLDGDNTQRAGHRHPEEHRERLRPAARRRRAGSARRSRSLATSSRRQPPITRARVEVHEHGWTRFGPHSFARSRPPHPHRGGRARFGRRRPASSAGSRDLVLLNTTNSEFWGFPRDQLHDAGRDQRSRAGHVGRRALAVPQRRGRLAGRVRARAGHADERLPRHVQLLAAADPVRDGDGGHRGRPGHLRGPARAAEQAPLPRRPRTVRPGQRQRGVLRGRPSVRADRGDGAGRRRPRPRMAWD